MNKEEIEAKLDEIIDMKADKHYIPDIMELIMKVDEEAFWNGNNWEKKKW